MLVMLQQFGFHFSLHLTLKNIFVPILYGSWFPISSSLFFVVQTNATSKKKNVFVYCSLAKSIVHFNSVLLAEPQRLLRFTVRLLYVAAYNHWEYPGVFRIWFERTLELQFCCWSQNEYKETLFALTIRGNMVMHQSEKMSQEEYLHCRAHWSPVDKGKLCRKHSREAEHSPKGDLRILGVELLFTR